LKYLLLLLILPLLIIPTVYAIPGISTEYILDFTVHNMRIVDISEDEDFFSLGIQVFTRDNASFEVTLPRSFIDSIFNGADSSFIVLADGDEPIFTEIQTNSENRTLSIELPSHTWEVEIIGTTMNGEVLDDNLPITEGLIYDSIVIVENPRVTNAFGLIIVDSLNIDQQVELTIDLTNYQDREQYFTTSVKVVRTHDDLLVYETSRSGSFSSYQTWSPTYSWTPQVAGEYLVAFNTIGNSGGKNISLHDESTTLITVETFEESNAARDLLYILKQKQLNDINHMITIFEKKINNIQNKIDYQQIRLDEVTLNNATQRIDKFTTNIESLTALQNIYESLLGTAQNQLELYS